MMMMTAEAETLNRAAVLFENTVVSDSFFHRLHLAIHAACLLLIVIDLQTVVPDSLRFDSQNAKYRLYCF